MTQDTLSEAEYDAITDAAAHWCMRLHAADCTDEERRAFEAWHEAHPLHAFEYEAMQEIWEVAGDLPRTEPEALAAQRKPLRSWRAPRVRFEAGLRRLRYRLAARGLQRLESGLGAQQLSALRRHRQCASDHSE